MAPYIIAAAILVVIVLFGVLWERREVYFSRDLAYDRANAILWTKYKQNAAKNVKALDTKMKQTYKYHGTGDFDGMKCRGPNNFRCTAYNNLMY